MLAAPSTAVTQNVFEPVDAVSIGALLAALLFGAFEALAVVMPGLFNWVPAELIRMIPFVVTILALVLFSIRAQRALALRGAR